MGKNETLVSIVVPVLDRAGTVRDTLDSIIVQSYGNFELIVVDNGSTDGTQKVLEEWQNANSDRGIDIHIVHCPAPGAAAARNHGVKLAGSPWVMFFDSDDIMYPDHLQRVADAIYRHSEAEIIGWDVDMLRLDGTSRRCRFFGSDMQRHNLFDGAMATQRWAARAELVRSVGCWDEAVGYWDDIELGSRMLATAPRIIYIGQGGVIVRESRVSISSAGARNPRSIEPALTRMEKTLGSKGRRWCRLKRAIEYALSSRSGSPMGLELMKEMKPSPMLRLAYYYTRAGGRGIARIMRF